MPGLPPSTTRYDETGAVIATLAGSQASYVGYGAHGRTSSTSMDLGNQRLYRESYRYEVDGFMRGRTITGIETGALATAADQPWSYTRGPRGSVREVLAPDGQQTIHTLDDLGAATRTVQGDVTIDRTFDLNGNLFTQAVGTEVTTLRYDGHDRLETTLLATGRELATEYEAGTLSRVRSTSVSGLSGPVEMETIFGNYDGVGRVTSPASTSFSARGLPPENAALPFERFELLKPVPADTAILGHAFGGGGGVQYELTQSIRALIAAGFLLVLP